MVGEKERRKGREHEAGEWQEEKRTD